MEFRSILMRIIWRLAPVLWLDWAIRNLAQRRAETLQRLKEAEVIDLIPDHRPDDDDDDFLAGVTRIRSSSAAGAYRYYDSGLIRGPPWLGQSERYSPFPTPYSQLPARSTAENENACPKRVWLRTTAISLTK